MSQTQAFAVAIGAGVLMGFLPWWLESASVLGSILVSKNMDCWKTFVAARVAVDCVQSLWKYYQLPKKPANQLVSPLNQSNLAKSPWIKDNGNGASIVFNVLLVPWVILGEVADIFVGEDKVKYRNNGDLAFQVVISLASGFFQGGLLYISRHVFWQ